MYKPHRNDGLFIKAASRLTDYKMSHYAVALKRPLLRLLDGLVYSGPAFAYNRFSALHVSELNGQPDEADVGDSPVPGWGERLDQLAFDCWMSLDYLQGYSNLFCTRDSQSDSYPVTG